MSWSMKWKLLRARSIRINRAPAAPRHALEHYCRDLNGWPRSWMGLEKDVSPGEQLLALFRPFLEHLAASELSPKTIQKHTDLARISRALIGKVEALDPTQRVVLDMDSTEIPVYGE